MADNDEMVGALDPFALAALRQRRGVMPDYGRQQGPASYVLENLVPHMAKGMLALPEQATHAAGDLQRTGDQYDPAPAMTAALMTMGATPFGAPRGALGAGPVKPDPFASQGKQKAFADWTAATEKALNSEAPPPLPSYSDMMPAGSMKDPWKGTIGEAVTPAEKPKFDYAQHLANMQALAKKQTQQFAKKPPSLADPWTAPKDPILQPSEPGYSIQAGERQSAIERARALEDEIRVKPANTHEEALAQEEAARQARARALGYDTKVYHGTQGEFRKPDDRFAHDWVFSTPNPDLANMYANHLSDIADPTVIEGANIKPLLLRTKDYHTYDAKGATWEGTNSKAVQEALRAKKAGVKITNVHDAPHAPYKLPNPDTVYISLDPSTIRSPYAKFDPNYFDQAGLLKGIAGAGATGAATQDPQVQEFIRALRSQ